VLYILHKDKKKIKHYIKNRGIHLYNFFFFSKFVFQKNKFTKSMDEKIKINDFAPPQKFVCVVASLFMMYVCIENIKVRYRNMVYKYKNDKTCNLYIIFTSNLCVE
jgi:hypothetical protein